METYPPAVRLAVITEWQTGESIRALARKHGIPESTIRGWLKGETRAVVAKKNKAHARPQDLDTLVVEVVYDNLRALQAIARQAQTPAWLERQGADGLHLFYGVLADKVIRVLSALERGAGETGAPNADAGAGAPPETADG